MNEYKKMVLNVKQVRILKEDIKSYLKVLYQNLADRLSGYLAPPEYTFTVLPLLRTKHLD